jgi:hypothetical protein
MVWVDGVMIVGAVLELIAIFLLELQCVASPDGVSQVIDNFEDSEGLLGRPIGGDLERDGERVAFAGVGHDLAFRRWRAR